MSGPTESSSVGLNLAGTDQLVCNRDRLLALVQSYGSCAVAFSGGVDSAVVAMAAHLTLGEYAVAVTGRSPSLASDELELARQQAAAIGIRHEIVDTQEMSQAAYVRNAGDRCYYCKTELYSHLEGLSDRFGMAVVANGANADDLLDHRPGMQAATEYSVQSPLADCGLTKADVRAIAAHWNLAVWDKPASPCLSSRIAYGEEVTPQRLAMIEQAEKFLRSQALSDVRVRYHRGDLARIEVPVADIARLCQPELRQAVVRELRAAGFRYVTIDFEGFRSGNLNQLIHLDVIGRQER